MCGSLVYIQSVTAEIKQGKKEERKKDRRKHRATRIWASAKRDVLPNIGGALCSALQSLADAHY